MAHSFCFVLHVQCESCALKKQRQPQGLKSQQREGKYANYFEVGHNAHEFVIDCGQFHDGDAESAYLHTRIITNPACVKGLLATLATSVRQYEERFGMIEEHNESGLLKH